MIVFINIVLYLCFIGNLDFECKNKNWFLSVSIIIGFGSKIREIYENCMYEFIMKFII